MSRRRLALAALCALLVVVGGWALLSTQSTNPAQSSDKTPSSSPAQSSQSTTRSTSRERSSAPPGMATCPVATLPSEVADTVRAIHSNGPFPFPRNDGVIFGNREGHLPDQARGFYHEYTVITPGAQNRSTRRVITGGTPVTDPRQYFYTGDHYDSFCLVVDAGGLR